MIKEEEEKEMKKNKKEKEEEEKLLEASQMARDDWFALLDHSASVSRNWGKSGSLQPPSLNPTAFTQASA